MGYALGYAAGAVPETLDLLLRQRLAEQEMQRRQMEAEAEAAYREKMAAEAARRTTLEEDQWKFQQQQIDEQKAKRQQLLEQARGPVPGTGPMGFVLSGLRQAGPVAGGEDLPLIKSLEALDAGLPSDRYNPAWQQEQMFAQKRQEETLKAQKAESDARNKAMIDAARINASDRGSSQPTLKQLPDGRWAALAPDPKTPGGMTFVPIGGQEIASGGAAALGARGAQVRQMPGGAKNFLEVVVPDPSSPSGYRSHTVKTTVRATADMINALNQLGNVEEIAQQMQEVWGGGELGSMVGPWAGRVNETLRYIGLLPKVGSAKAAQLTGLPEDLAQIQAEKLYQLLNTYRNMLLYARTGKQINVEELRRMDKELPREVDEPPKFITALEQSWKNLALIRKRYNNFLMTGQLEGIDPTDIMRDQMMSSHGEVPGMTPETPVGNRVRIVRDASGNLIPQR